MYITENLIIVIILVWNRSDTNRLCSAFPQGFSQQQFHFFFLFLFWHCALRILIRVSLWFFLLLVSYERNSDNIPINTSVINIDCYSFNSNKVVFVFLVIRTSKMETFDCVCDNIWEKWSEVDIFPNYFYQESLG